MTGAAKEWSYCWDCHKPTQGRVPVCATCKGDNIHVLQQPAPWSDAQAEQYLTHGASTGALKVHYTARWAQTLHKLTYTLANGRIRDEHDARLALYWIKLWGAIEYFPDEGVELQRAFKEGFPTAEEPSGMRWLREQQQLAGAVRDSLKEDELIYAYWRRQVEAHVDQTKFRMSVRRSGEIKDTWSIPGIARALTVDDLIKARKAVSARYDEDDLRVAEDFARKTFAPVTGLWSVVLQSVRPIPE